ncbi:MAG: MFS transporter [Planctomycetota bacterium]|nr:MAG: MFS transporter [Planctomycetota bacterium]
MKPAQAASSPQQAAPGPAGALPAPALSPSGGARYGLGVLALINLVHFLDRYVVFAVLAPIQRDLGIGDAEAGLLASAFLVVFMFTSPVFGWLGDRFSRKRTIAAGVALWSAATAAGGLAPSFGVLLATRAAVGVGEASYATIAPTLIADWFPPQQRARALAVFYAAAPVGAALGFILGGVVEARWGWRAVFFLAGLPGLLLALLQLTVREPPRGAFEGADPAAGEPAPSLLRCWRELARNRRYCALVAGYTAYTFAVGGLAVWMPTFLHRVRGMALEQANLWIGAVTVVGGFAGTFAGGWLADRWRLRQPEAYAALAGLASLLAAPFVAGALLLGWPPACLACLFLAEILLFAISGPVNGAILEAVAPSMRASAVAASILVMHLLGDAISPAAIGAVSDAVRQLLGEGAQAAGRGLLAGTLIVPVFVVLAGLAWGWIALRRPAAAAPAAEPPG